MRVKKGNFQENNYFSDLGYCCVLVKKFLNIYCQNDISKLGEFNFLRIVDDSEFGDVGKSGARKKKASVSNTQIVKAIFFLLYGDKFTFSFDELYSKIPLYKLNQFDVLFGEDYELKTLNNILKDEKYKIFLEKVRIFYQKINSVGNFMFFPDIELIECLTDDEKGFLLWNFPYSDVFLNEIKGVLGEDKSASTLISKFIDNNDFYFSSDYINWDFKSFCDFNLISDYIDIDCNIVNDFGPNYRFVDLLNDREDKIFKDVYVNFAMNYICKVESLIQKRGQKVFSILSNRVN